MGGKADAEEAAGRDGDESLLETRDKVFLCFFRRRRLLARRADLRATPFSATAGT